jgi:hypothetical protein
MVKKILNLYSNCKFEFSIQLMEFLNILPKPYTLDEISNIVKTKVFKKRFSKENITWEEIDLFQLKQTKSRLTFKFVMDFIKSHLIVREANEPECNFYYYYQIPVKVDKIIWEGEK